MATGVKSFSQAAEAAGLPKRIKMEDLAALGSVVYTAAHPDTARLPGTDTETEGCVVTVTSPKDGKEYECFVGAKILVSALARIEFPFQARIVKSGQSWTFVD